MAKHIYHYNVNSEQRFFLGRRHRPLFDIIALSGNIVSHTPAGVAAFVATSGKPFFIDPQTHAFQHPTINLKRDVSDKDKDEEPDYQFKPSVVRLAKERLKSPFTRVIERDKPLSPSDFLDEKGDPDSEKIGEVCNNVVAYQRDTLYESIDEDDKEFLGDDNPFKPEFIIAPYFYLSSRDFVRWLKINAACYRKTCELVKDLPVFLAAVISKQFLDLRKDHLVRKVSELKPDGILLWIDEHTEEELRRDQIRAYIGLLRELKTHTKTILNSHGGYLSTLLCHPDAGEILSGVGHAINYGEHRSVIPVGGGLPMARFYYPSIHSRLRYGDALEIIRAKGWLNSREAYESNVCNCEQCLELLNNRNTVDEAFFTYGDSTPITFERRSRKNVRQIVRLDYPTAEAKQAAARHYLFTKYSEFSWLERASLKELIQELKQTYDDLSEYVDDRAFSHLSYWHSELSEKFP